MHITLGVAKRELKSKLKLKNGLSNGVSNGVSAEKLEARLDKIRKIVKKDTKVEIQTLTRIGSGSRVPCIRTQWREMDDWLTGDHDKSNNLTVNSGRGMPKGRIIEIYGLESTGKTTVTLQLIAAYQKQGHICAFIDVEHAFDPKYATSLGVDVTKLLLHQPDSAEQALNIVNSLARTKLVALIVIDSVAALDPEAEQDKKSGKVQPGLQARLMSQACRKLTPLLAKSESTVIFLNQIRSKIGIMFGNPNTTSGGNALKFYASVRIELTKIKLVKKGFKAIGTIVKARTVKNKVSEPFRDLWLHMSFGKGITRVEIPKAKLPGDVTE